MRDNQRNLFDLSLTTRSLTDEEGMLWEFIQMQDLTTVIGSVQAAQATLRLLYLRSEDKDEYERLLFSPSGVLPLALTQLMQSFDRMGRLRRLERLLPEIRLDTDNDPI